MTTNADMTIYNYWYNPKTKEREYRRTQIMGVHWHTDQKVAIIDKGVVGGDIYKIRIPQDAATEEGRRYLAAELYHKLSVDNVGRYWTVDKEDLFVKGLVDDDVTGLSSLKQYPESGKIMSFSMNGYGAAPHIRIGGAR